VQRTKSKVEGK
jgi:hypothetical protein